MSMYTCSINFYDNESSAGNIIPSFLVMHASYYIHDVMYKVVCIHIHDCMHTQVYSICEVDISQTLEYRFANIMISIVRSVQREQQSLASVCVFSDRGAHPLEIRHNNIIINIYYFDT